MPDEPFAVRREIGLERGYDGREYATDALTRRQKFGRHYQKKARNQNPEKLNRAGEFSDIEGSEPDWHLAGGKDVGSCLEGVLPKSASCHVEPFGLAQDKLRRDILYWW